MANKHLDDIADRKAHLTRSGFSYEKPCLKWFDGSLYQDLLFLPLFTMRKKVE